jgi:Mn2+/Fe2+ NRAMP family transporter
MGLSPVKALVAIAIIYGLTAPLIIFMILLVSNNKQIMGEYRNSKISNFLGIVALIVMIGAGLLLLTI